MNGHHSSCPFDGWMVPVGMETVDHTNWKIGNTETGVSLVFGPRDMRTYVVRACSRCDAVEWQPIDDLREKALTR